MHGFEFVGAHTRQDLLDCVRNSEQRVQIFWFGQQIEAHWEPLGDRLKGQVKAGEETTQGQGTKRREWSARLSFSKTHLARKINIFMIEFDVPSKSYVPKCAYVR